AGQAPPVGRGVAIVQAAEFAGGAAVLDPQELITLGGRVGRDRADGGGDHRGPGAHVRRDRGERGEGRRRQRQRHLGGLGPAQLPPELPGLWLVVLFQL